MYTVYILESELNSDRHYIGFTHKQVEERLVLHNEGSTPASARYRPWEIVWSCKFLDKEQALAFESYLKSGSGRAFAAKRLLPCPPKPPAKEGGTS
ncbi:MAG: GIY-YIG nuclease family protein [Kiritimatiellae bacterium]|nr:GIY-YIG nuclease family protein [Kiritimatiellia bacterium]